MKSKKQLVKEHLLKHGEITPLEALQKYGSFRLSAIIYELRKEGLKIETQINKEKHYANYILIEDKEPDDWASTDVHGWEEREAREAEQSRIDHENAILERIHEDTNQERILDIF